MALLLLRDIPQRPRQGYRLVTEVEEVIGEEDEAPTQVGALVPLVMHAWAKRWDGGREVVDRVTIPSAGVGVIILRDLVRELRPCELVILLHCHLLGHDHGIHNLA